MREPIPDHPLSWLLSKRQIMTSVGKDTEKLELIHCWREYKVETVYQLLKVISTELSRDPAIPRPGTRPREIKTHVHTKTCARTFTAALVVTARGWNDTNVYQAMDGQTVCGWRNYVTLFSSKRKNTIHAATVAEP